MDINVYIYIPVSGCELSTVFVLSCSNELVTWGRFWRMFRIFDHFSWPTPNKHSALWRGSSSTFSLKKSLSKSPSSAGGGFDGSDSRETCFPDYMAGTQRHSPATGPLRLKREASLAGKFRWQGLLGAPWRNLSGNLYAHGRMASKICQRAIHPQAFKLFQLILKI